MKNLYIITFIFISQISYGQTINKNKSDIHITLKPEEIKRTLIDSLNKHNSTDSCEIYIENGALQIGHFMNTATKYALIVVDDNEFILYENKSLEWSLICESKFQNTFHGYKLKDINGDGCLDLLLPEVYIFDNITFKVILYDCKTKTLMYNPEYDGLFNPEYDAKTGLINEYLMTNHGEIEKETYKFTVSGLELNEKITLDGAGIEDRNKNKFVIKHYVKSGKKLILIKTIRTVNYNNAIKQFDSLLFDTSINQNQFRPKLNK